MPKIGEPSHGRPSDILLFAQSTDLESDARPIAEVPGETLASAARTGRIVARLGAERFPVYGRNVYESSRIDAFLDASLVFARDGQIYLLALSNGEMSSDLYSRMKGSFAAYLSGIEQALAPQRGFLVGDNVTLADVCFVSELCLFHNERARISALKTGGFSILLDNEFVKSFPRSAAHFRRLLGHPAFVPDVAGYLEKIERNELDVR